MERRAIDLPVELRQRDDGKNIISGYALVFDSESEDLGGFREIIRAGSLDGAKMSDTVALFNHDKNMILGRTPKTLSLSIDNRGLRYEIEPADTQAGRDIVKSIERGDVRGSSFAFTIKEDKWDENNETYTREILKFDQIFDVSPVVFPAYQSTDVSMAKRDLGLIKDKKEREQTEQLELEAQKRKSEINKQQKHLNIVLKLKEEYNDYK